MDGAHSGAIPERVKGGDVAEADDEFVGIANRLCLNAGKQTSAAVASACADDGINGRISDGTIDFFESPRITQRFSTLCSKMIQIKILTAETT